MRKLLLPVLAMVFCTAAIAYAFSGQEYGKPLTLKEVTKVSEIESNPEKFVGKKVLIKGTIVEVCSKRGCWMDIASDTPFAKIQVKVVDGVIVFPMSARGKNAHVEGIVEKLAMSKNEAFRYYKHKAKEGGTKFDPATITGPVTMYRIKALGAVIE